jgi:hypothetical protein
MSQPSYASSRPTPEIPTNVAGEAGNMVDVQDSQYDVTTNSVEASLAGMATPQPGHPAYGGNAGAGALGYQGFNDGQLEALGQ